MARKYSIPAIPYEDLVNRKLWSRKKLYELAKDRKYFDDYYVEEKSKEPLSNFEEFLNSEDAFYEGEFRSFKKYYFQNKIYSEEYKIINAADILLDNYFNKHISFQDNHFDNLDEYDIDLMSEFDYIEYVSMEKPLSIDAINQLLYIYYFLEVVVEKINNIKDTHKRDIDTEKEKIKKGEQLNKVYLLIYFELESNTTTIIGAYNSRNSAEDKLKLLIGKAAIIWDEEGKIFENKLSSYYYIKKLKIQ